MGLLAVARSSLQVHFVPHQKHQLGQLAPEALWSSPWQADWWQTHMMSWHLGDSIWGPPAEEYAPLQRGVSHITLHPAASVPPKCTRAPHKHKHFCCPPLNTMPPVQICNNLLLSSTDLHNKQFFVYFFWASVAAEHVTPSASNALQAWRRIAE